MDMIGEGDVDLIKAPIVIDNGSGIMKAGLGGESEPSLVFNSYVGRPIHEKVMITQNEQDTFIGDAADKYRGILKFNYPIEHGIIQNWDDMEQLWRHVFDELKVSPKEHPILLTEPPLNPYSNRVKTADIFFEKFGAPKIFFQQQAVLSLYARGKTSGVVLDCGDGVCHCSPVFEGFSINNAIQRIDLGGRDVTKHLQLLLRRAGYVFHTTTEFEIVKRIKELQCYVSVPIGLDIEYHKEKEDKNTSNYHLPDGQVIQLGSEKFKAPEILFSPDKIGLEWPGVHEMVINSIKKCDIDVRKTLYNSIIVAGGTSLLTGFNERLHKSIQKLASRDVTITLMAPRNRKYSCWVGGATVSGLKAFNRMWISKKDFDEEGSRILFERGL